MRVGYNEIDPYCCAWLENLMSAGLIPIGKILQRDVRDIQPGELDRFDQLHFFAGLGGWPYALELAGWNGPCWTGSCPCQPFSAAGKGLGFADERHLWPAWERLIAKQRPAVVFGEQVARASEWLVLVRSDLEALGYAVGCVPIEAASVGARHKRDRYWFVADAFSHQLRNEPGRRRRPNRKDQTFAGNDGSAQHMADTDRAGLAQRQEQSAWQERAPAERSRHVAGDVGNAPLLRRDGQSTADTRSGGEERWPERTSGGSSSAEADADREPPQRSAVAWPERDPWLVEPDVGRVVARLPQHVDQLRALGNSIVPQCAAAFVSAYMGIRDD